MGMLALVMLCTVEMPVGPLDAFQANYHATKVDLRYHYTGGYAPEESLEHLRSGSFDTVPVNLKPEWALDGRWSCDGTGELLSCKSSDPAPIANAAQPTDGAPVFEEVDFELLAADEIQAENRLHQKVVQVFPDPGEGLYMGAQGPFCWWAAFQFPRSLRKFSECKTPALLRRTIQGREVAVCIEHIDHPQGGWARLEVTYDPSVGFLPRHVRLIGASAGGGGVCKDMYLVEAKPCAEGGFVPVELYTTIIATGEPKRMNITDFDPDLKLEPIYKDKIVVGHLKVTEFKDRKGPVALEQLQNVHTIAGRGGQVPLVSKVPLTVARIKSLLGRKLTATLPRPTADAEEMERFKYAPEPGWSWPGVFAVMFAVAVPLGWFWRWRRRAGRLAALLIGVLAVSSSSGCGKLGAPRVSLRAEFDRSHVLFAPHQPTLELSLITRNDGNVPIKIFKVDPSCQCRRVDSSSFPFTLAPGGSRPVGISVAAASSREDKHNYLFSYETDHGVLKVPLSLVTLPRHSFYPEGLGSPTLIEQEPWECELVHKAIFQPGGDDAPVVLNVPPEFEATTVGTRRGRLEIARDFEFVETTYRLALKDRNMGMRKEIIGLKSADGTRALEVPVVWNRVPFLSTTPARASVGPRPIRVFLRCPDAEIELTRVLSAPKGIKAVVSSPREVTISCTKDAPAVIDGTIEVATTAKDRAPLRFPVARFTLAQVPH